MQIIVCKKCQKTIDYIEYKKIVKVYSDCESCKKEEKGA